MSTDDDDDGAAANDLAAAPAISPSSDDDLAANDLAANDLANVAAPTRYRPGEGRYWDALVRRMLPPSPDLAFLLLRVSVPPHRLGDFWNLSSYVSGFHDGRQIRLRRQNALGLEDSASDDDEMDDHDHNEETDHDHFLTAPWNQSASAREGGVRWCLQRVGVRGAPRATDCSICFEPIFVQDAVPVLRCTHLFHARCFSAWVTRRRLHAACPLCRAPLWPRVAENLQTVLQESAAALHESRGQDA